MGVIPDDVDHDKLYEDVNEMRQKYYHVPLNQVSVGIAVQDLFQVAYNHRIHIPNEMTLLGKSILTMESVATFLDPNISVVDVAEPFGKKLFWDRLNPFVNRLSFSIVLLALSIVILGLIVGGAISGTVSPIIGKVPIVEISFFIALLMILWLLFAIFRPGRF